MGVLWRTGRVALRWSASRGGGAGASRVARRAGATTFASTGPVWLRNGADRLPVTSAVTELLIRTMSGVKSGGGGGGGAAGGAGGAASTDAAAVPALDKAKFSSVVKLTAVRVEARKTAAAMKALGGSLLKMPRVKTVVDMGGSSPHRLVLLAKQFAPDKEGIDGLPEEHRDFVKSQALSTETYELRLGYDDLGVDEVLRELLPPHLDVPSSFESAGHLAHLNLRDGHEPYRFLIGQVVLDKNKRLRTVVNKVGQIHAEFRTFDMELLAGEPDFEVTLKESGATFTFNFKDVYWNSRLQMEHRRMIEAFTKDDVVCELHPADPPTTAADVLVCC